MRRDHVTEVIPASCEEVFDLVHDYARRLEWDTLLSEAYLVPGHAVAAKGAVSVCVGPWSFEARPRWLRWLLEPVMAHVFRWETRKRLRALRAYFAQRRGRMPISSSR